MGQKSILFRCDGSTEIGLGHVVRCLALADELSRVHHVPCAFAMRHSPLIFDMVMQKGYPVLTPQAGEQPFDYIQWLERAISQVEAGALILDVRDDLPRQGVDAWRRQGGLIVTLDDPSERRLSADLAFYPPVPQVQRLDWSGFTGQLYAGWEWILLRREFSRYPAALREFSHCPVACRKFSHFDYDMGSFPCHCPVARPHHKRPVVLVTMGGSDPAELTLKAVEAFDLLDEDFEAVLVLGPAFPHHDALKKLLAGTRRSFTLMSCVADMPGLMAQSDLAVISFGATAYELASMSVPAIYLCLTQDHAESASMLVEAGIGKTLGVASYVSVKMLAEAVSEFLAWIACGEEQTPERPIDGRGIDGRGAERIARIVAGRMKGQKK